MILSRPTRLLMIVLLALSPFALADEKSPIKPVEQPVYLLQGISFDRSIDCKKAVNNYEVSQCRAIEVQTQEQVMLAQLAQLQRVLKNDKEALTTLTQAHETWIVWQWHEAKLCAHNSGFSEAGSGFGLAIANCRAAQIATRQQQLNEYLRSYRSRLSR